MPAVESKTGPRPEGQVGGVEIGCRQGEGSLPGMEKAALLLTTQTLCLLLANYEIVCRRNGKLLNWKYKVWMLHNKLLWDFILIGDALSFLVLFYFN